MEKRKNQAAKPLTGNTKPLTRSIARPVSKTSPVQKPDEAVVPAPVLTPEEARTLANTYYLEAMMIKAKDPGKAVKLLQKAISVNPELPEAFFYLALLQFESGNYDQALETYLKLLEINPNHEAAAYNTGNIYYIMYNFEKALEYFKKTEELNPDAIDAIYNSGFICLRHFKDYLTASLQFRKVLKIRKEHTDARYNLGISEYFLGNKQEALKIFEELIRIAPGFNAPYYNLAMLYKELGASDRAMVMLQKYLDQPEKSIREVKHVRYAARRLKEFHNE